MKEEFYISLIGEAFDGYTEAVFKDRFVYVKHISIRDQRYLHKYYEKYRQIALQRGLESEEERMSYVLGEGIWEEKDDLQIESLEKEVENLKRTAKALFLPSQQKSLQEQAIRVEFGAKVTQKITVNCIRKFLIFKMNTCA